MGCCIADEMAAADVPGHYFGSGAAAFILPFAVVRASFRKRSGIDN